MLLRPTGDFKSGTTFRLGVVACFTADGLRADELYTRGSTAAYRTAAVAVILYGCRSKRTFESSDSEPPDSALALLWLCYR